MRIGRILRDRIAGKSVWMVSAFIGLLLFLIVGGLLIKSWPILQTHSLNDLLFKSLWKPRKNLFGFLPYILSTVYVTMISILIAVPLCVLCTIYLSEYANKKVKNFVTSLVDILAGIPSVIFGIWGIIMVVPFISNTLAPAFGVEDTTGYSILAGGLVLAIMVFPIVIHIMLEVLRTVPVELREASLSLGANKWETIKKVVLRRAAPGISAAIVLGFSRAFGETLAVLMVVGNTSLLPHSLFDSGYPLPALIANNYGEMMSIPMYDSALMFAALLLLTVILLFNVVARMVIMRVERKMA
ncbi:MAG TPA: phosphate ABC transporter permease subunit PstC [Chitinophagales bacterium]|nr:phosphate ABC transporter permease subunit PstC [Chitinophagales bacterium]